MPIQNINGKLRLEPTPEQVTERTERIDAQAAYDIFEARFIAMRDADLAQAQWADLEDLQTYQNLAAADRLSAIRLAILANRDAIQAQRDWNIAVGRMLRFVVRWILKQR